MITTDENAKKFVCVLNKKIPIGKLCNALGHMTAGLAGAVVDTNDMVFLQYIDADGSTHPTISHYPFIILKADNSNKIRTIRNQAIKRGLAFTDFTSTMTFGSSADQLERTQATKEIDLEYYGICLFGPSDILSELTGKLSLFQ